MKEPVPLAVLAKVVASYLGTTYMSYHLFQRKYGEDSTFEDVVRQKCQDNGVEAWMEEDNLNIILHG